MEVYKDECSFTFDNQESPHGIDVCLTCYIGTSPAPEHNFTAKHARVKSHTAFLNLRKVPKSTTADVSDEDQEHRPKKLAIARENEEEKFETVATFKTLAQDSEEDFKSAINHVLTADSYSKAKETEAWELELQPCEHVAIHESVFANVPAQRLSHSQLSSCSKCDLDKNLWLCLECGALGCGRRHFDGSGGNGHALQHFEQTQHALAVKLGSITPDGHVDVFCYAHNDDVSDPGIRDHLAHWGIDIAKQSKTEKSMTELQLEQNLTWDFAGAEDAERVSGKGLTGLTNLGNTCYLNSVVQNLFAVPEFADLFEPNDPNSDDEGGPMDLTTQLRKMKDGLESGRYEHVSPVMLKYLIGKSHPEFATMRQQDAFEFLTHLLTVVSKSVKNDPARLFGFESERRIACTQCDAVRYIVEKQENISISVPIEETGENEFKPVHLNTLLDIYTAEEVIDSTCPKCKAPQAISTVNLKSFPQVLVMNVRRFRIVNWVPQKVDVPVIVSNHLNLDKYLSTGPQPDENVISNDVSSDDTSEPQPDPEQLVMLSSMGFPEQQCINALRLVSKRGQPNNLEAAMEAILSGEATNETPNSSSKQPNRSVDPESQVMLESMGFSGEQATAALQENNSNVEAAVEWLFAGKYDEFVANSKANEPSSSTDTTEELLPLGDSALPANYELKGAVLHKGASVHVGHYIAAVRRGNETYVFNDEKVSKGADVERLQEFAYIYMFDRTRQ